LFQSPCETSLPTIFSAHAGPTPCDVCVSKPFAKYSSMGSHSSSKHIFLHHAHILRKSSKKNRRPLSRFLRMNSGIKTMRMATVSMALSRQFGKHSPPPNKRYGKQNISSAQGSKTSIKKPIDSYQSILFCLRQLLIFVLLNTERLLYGFRITSAQLVCVKKIRTFAFNQL